MISPRPRLLFFLCASFAWLALSSAVSASDETLVRAKDLYRSAAYDEALALLDGMPAVSAPADRVEASEYRVFCLIALDRKDEARSAIETMINADPFYHLPADQASPRVRSVFQEVRQALLPMIVQRTYNDAKAAFDRKDPQAAAAFERVIALLDDPDLKAAGTLADLRTVAKAFHDLSAAMAERPSPAQSAPSSPRSAASATPVEAASAERASSPTAAASQIVYDEAAPNVVPPAVIDQTMPKWLPPAGSQIREWRGAIEVVIDEAGNVVSATMRSPIHPSYDWQLIKAAQSWKYRPATRNGVPARFVKVVTVRLNSTN